MIPHDIKAYIKGECYICKTKTDNPDAYCHNSCAIAISDDRMRRVLEAQRKREEKEAKK